MYSDIIFDVTYQDASSEEDRKEKGLLTKFEVDYTPGAPQALVDSGETVLVSPSQMRQIPEGSTHTIDTGVFHQPTIPEGFSAATLVLSSFRVHEGGPFVLLDGPPDTIKETRKSVSSDDKKLVHFLLK